MSFFFFDYNQVNCGLIIYQTFSSFERDCDKVCLIDI